jgi:hypothetical protein
VGSSTSHNPRGLHGLLKGQLFFFHHVPNEPVKFTDELIVKVMIAGGHETRGETKVKRSIL